MDAIFSVLIWQGLKVHFDWIVFFELLRELHDSRAFR